MSPTTPPPMPPKDHKKSGLAWGSHLLAAAVLMLPLQLFLHRAQPPKPLPDHSDARVLLNKYGCVSCHSIQGRGGSQGPPLDRVALKHDRAWFEAWLDDPQSLKADTVMPSFRDVIHEKDKERLLDYLLTLRGPKKNKTDRTVVMPDEGRTP